MDASFSLYKVGHCNIEDQMLGIRSVVQHLTSCVTLNMSLDISVLGFSHYEI